LFAFPAITELTIIFKGTVAKYADRLSVQREYYVRHDERMCGASLTNVMTAMERLLDQ
jgi:hypothetical protein